MGATSGKGCRLEKLVYDNGGWGEFGMKADRRHGPSRTFYANGRPRSERTFVNGRQHGVSRGWNSRGRLTKEVLYQDDALHGHWKEWNARGKLTRNDKFEFGERVSKGRRRPAVSGVLEKALLPFRKLTAEQAGKQLVSAERSLMQRPLVPVAKKASLPRDRLTSLLRLVTHAPRGESWPEVGGRHLVPLLQVRVDELPVSPPALKGIAFFSVFAPHEYPYALVVQVAATLRDLVPLVVPENILLLKPAVIGWKQGSAEYPNSNDLPPGLRAYAEDKAPRSPLLRKQGRFETRVGGWPCWLQSTAMRGFGDFIAQIDHRDFDDWDAFACTTQFYLFRKPGSKAIWSYCEMT
jgi:hypothetical protein